MPTNFKTNETTGIVGDKRVISVYSVDSSYRAIGPCIGTAWQANDGRLNGTGVLAVMLFEPSSLAMYENFAGGLDVSPLAILYRRLAGSSFLYTEISEKNE